MANLAALQDKEKTLSEKLAKLKKGEINCAEREGDGRQDEAIARTEGFLRGVRKEISEIEGKSKK